MKSKLIKVFLPGPIETIIGIVLVSAIEIFGLTDKLFELIDKNEGYRLAFGAIGIAISLPCYLRIRKELQKYEEERWDDK